MLVGAKLYIVQDAKLSKKQPLWELLLKQRLGRAVMPRSPEGGQVARSGDMTLILTLTKMNAHSFIQIIYKRKKSSP